jgi:hypothetical protein
VALDVTTQVVPIVWSVVVLIVIAAALFWSGRGA